MITYEMIRKRLIAAIRESGFSQEELAEQLNVRQQSVAQYLSGRAMPALDTFANLCRILDEDPAYLLNLKD